MYIFWTYLSIMLGFLARSKAILEKRTNLTVFANITRILNISTTFTDLLHLLYFSVSRLPIYSSVSTDIFLCFYRFIYLFLSIYSYVSTVLLLCFYWSISLFLSIFSLCFYRFILLFLPIYSSFFLSIYSSVSTEIFFGFYRWILLFLLIYFSVYTDLFICF